VASAALAECEVAIQTCKADSLVAFVGEVLSLLRGWFPDEPCTEVWFRGVCNSEYQLLPGAYRHADCDETSLVLSFRNAVPSYVNPQPADEFEWYYLMQHYGLPTRLLDWTELPLAALYFALHRRAEAVSPCVWLMDPVDLNQLAHGPKADVIIVPTVISDSITFWLPSDCGRGKMLHTFEDGNRFADNAKPLAIFPKRYNPRIVAQRGVFTVHGIEETPIEVLFEQSPKLHRIARIDVTSATGAAILDDLWALGVNHTALFPEPQSVAEDLKRAYRVGVARPVGL